MLIKFSSLAAPDVVILTTTSTVHAVVSNIKRTAMDCHLQVQIFHFGLNYCGIPLIGSTRCWCLWKETYWWLIISCLDWLDIGYVIGQFNPSHASHFHALGLNLGHPGMGSIAQDNCQHFGRYWCTVKVNLWSDELYQELITYKFLIIHNMLLVSLNSVIWTAIWMVKDEIVPTSFVMLLLWFL